MSETNSNPDGPRSDDIDEEEKIDEGVDGTFPASDPPSTGGSTGPNDP